MELCEEGDNRTHNTPDMDHCQSFVFTISVELYADAIIRIAAEESPQNDHENDYGYACNDVDAIGAEES